MNQNFPEDEFDQIPYDATYYGTHRQAMPAHQERSRFKWIAIAGLAALVIGAFSFFLLPILLDDDDSAPTATQSASPTVTETAEPTQEETTEQSPEQTTDPTEEPDPAQSPIDSETPEPTESPETTESEEALNIDYGLTVEVYQTNTAIDSAANAAVTLQNQGFSVPVNGFWQGAPITTSYVFYADESQRDTAQAVADALGIENVEQGIVPTVVVVLSNG